MLSRGLPVSVLVHAIALVVMVMFGNHVARNPIKPSRPINVKIVRLPEQVVEQTEAPPDYRARVMALYQLAMLGAAPVGALLMGLIVADSGSVTSSVTRSPAP